jgi:hypothetical protein
MKTTFTLIRGGRYTEQRKDPRAPAAPTYPVTAAKTTGSEAQTSSRSLYDLLIEDGRSAK